MRRLIGSGLLLALALITAGAHAEEIRWRPAGPRPVAAPPGRQPAASGGVTLRQPIPLHPTAEGEPAGVTPASFTSGTLAPTPRLVRAKNADPVARPMPSDPALSPNHVVVPNGGPAVHGQHAPSASAEVWGTVVSRWEQNGFSAGGEAVPMGDGGLGGDVPCGDGCAISCGPCCGRRRLFHRLWCWDDPCCGAGCQVWGRAEYLLWTIRDMEAPPLVTASPPGTPRAQAGVLGAPGTVVLLGGGDIDQNMFSGGRFTLGLSLPCLCGWGIESTYFFLGRRTEDFIFGSNGTPILARPINNVRTGEEESQLVAFPGVVVGSVAVSTSSSLWGVEGNFRKPLCCGCNYNLDCLFGFRYLELDESLTIREDLSVLNASQGSPAGTRIMVFDQFRTRNHFYGGQFGFEGDCRWGCWSLGGQFKLGLGSMRQIVEISGAQAFMVPGVGTTGARGGVLALPTNIGRSASDHFCVIPEVGARLGYQLTDHVKLYAGYTFLYASSVVRPGEQIDRVINKTQIPTVFGPSPLVGAARPRPLFETTDFWAQGVNFGLEIRY